MFRNLATKSFLGLRVCSAVVHKSGKFHAAKPVSRSFSSFLDKITITKTSNAPEEEGVKTAAWYVELLIVDEHKQHPCAAGRWLF